MKKLPHPIIVGQQGINLIERIVLEMGCVWHPSHLDAGIDGYIEIRNPATGEMTNGIIQVQSKATEQEFESETVSSFEYRCAPRDLEYWLAGNAPVILIRSRPKTAEAYWISIKDYFRDLPARKAGRITFEKSRDSFDAKALDSLLRLAVPADSGIYLGTLPRTEKVYTNLLRLSSLPSHYYVARTDYRTREEVFAVLHETLRDAPGDWILSNKSIRSFHDLSIDPWVSVCDQGTVDPIPTAEWSNNQDEDERRLFVRMLNACLRDKLYPKGMSFSKENGYYYFRATRDLRAREYPYLALQHRTSRAVFKGYPKRRDPTKMSFYRHSAFHGRFVRYEDSWYLQITPTYHFTRDGWKPSFYGAELTTGIKRLETHGSVLGQVVMWANVLGERSLFDAGPELLVFNSLVDFEFDVGIEDDSWLKREAADQRKTLEGRGSAQLRLL